MRHTKGPKLVTRSGLGSYSTRVFRLRSHVAMLPATDREERAMRREVAREVGHARELAETVEVRRAARLVGAVRALDERAADLSPFIDDAERRAVEKALGDTEGRDVPFCAILWARESLIPCLARVADQAVRALERRARDEAYKGSSPSDTRKRLARKRTAREYEMLDELNEAAVLVSNTVGLRLVASAPTPELVALCSASARVKYAISDGTLQQFMDWACDDVDTHGPTVAAASHIVAMNTDEEVRREAHRRACAAAEAGRFGRHSMFWTLGCEHWREGEENESLTGAIAYALARRR